MKPEIRKDYLLNKYVIIAPNRARRPNVIGEKATAIAKPSPFTFDQLNPKVISDSIGRGEGRVIAIPNIFSAVSPSNKKAYGFQEVIIETPFDNRPLSTLSVEQIDRVLAMYARRTAVFMKKPGVEYVLCFKNQGQASGASIGHAHSQVIALCLLPPELAEEARLAEAYHAEHGRSYYADLINREMKSPRRIFENNEIAVFTPYASDYQYEAWILSKRRADNITRLTVTERKAVAMALKKIVTKLDQLELDYNFFCHQVISNRHQHFCLKIEPRGSIWGGVELGSGLVINSVAPEEAAKFYRR